MHMPSSVPLNVVAPQQQAWPPSLVELQRLRRRRDNLARRNGKKGGKQAGMESGNHKQLLMPSV
ncbi:hypothetical protein V6N13_089559 [Hibiscus sabdariffa]